MLRWIKWISSLSDSDGLDKDREAVTSLSLWTLWSCGTRVWIFASSRSIVGGAYQLADTEIDCQCESRQLTGQLTDYQAGNALQLGPRERLFVVLALTVG